MKTKEAENVLSLFLAVGITGLEPATSRPPDVCATNCAKSRTIAFSGCKGKQILRTVQILAELFSSICIIMLIFAPQIQFVTQ